MVGHRTAALLDESLSARENTSGREKLDRHVGETLELLLAFDDLRAIVLDDALGSRAQLRDVLLEVLLMRREPRVERDIECRRRPERAPQSRRSESANEAEIAHRLAKGGTDLLQSLSGTLYAIECDEQSQDLVRALDDPIDAGIAKTQLVEILLHVIASRVV